MAKIDLNPDNYKSTLWGRVAESFYEEREGNEVWRQLIVRQNRTDIGFQDIKSSQDCKICADQNFPYKDVWHMHQNLWANPAKGSPLHKFLVSLKEHGRITLTDPAQLKGHNFEFEEVKMPDWKNKETGEEVVGRRYYYVTNNELDAADEPKPVVAPLATANGSSNELPWDAGNNTAPPEAISSADSALYETLAKYADGKNDAEIKQGLIIRQEVPEIVNSPNLRVKIMNNKAVDELVEMQVLIKGDDGKYKYALA